MEIKEYKLNVKFVSLKLTREVMDEIVDKYSNDGQYTFSDKLGEADIDDFYNIDIRPARHFTIVGESSLKGFHEGDNLVYLPDYKVWFPAQDEEIS